MMTFNIDNGMLLINSLYFLLMGPGGIVGNLRTDEY